MNERFVQYLTNKNCFKLVLGANNSNYEEITNLCALYSSVGCRFFDIEASIEAYNALINGINQTKLKREDIFICISVGVNQDPHLTKFKIDKSLCKMCGKCAKFCLEGAICADVADIKNIQYDKINPKNANNTFLKIQEEKCIGCGKCYKNTNCPALKSYQKIKNRHDVLDELFNKTDCVEFHAITENIYEIDEKWEYLTSNFDGVLSICLDRSFLGDRKIIEQLNKMITKAKEKNNKRKIIIQSDGAPMSGGVNDYKTTLQTVAFADLINKNNIDSFILLSGGTNAKTAELARFIGVEFNGISLGSYARKIVKEFVSEADFLNNPDKFNKAKTIAQELFNSI